MRSSNPYPSRIVRAEAKVEASGAVGPLAMTSRSSPITSLSIRHSMAAGQASRASCPPLTIEMCLRTALISWILAPHASSNFVTACFSSSVTGGAGAGSSAEPPPDIRAMIRSSSPACPAMRAMRVAPATPAASGSGWPHSFNSTRLTGAR